MSGCSCTSFVRRFGNTRSPRFSRISAFRPSQMTIQSPLPIFILVIEVLRGNLVPFEMGSKMLFEILKGLADRFGTFRMPETSWGAGASRSQPLKLPGPGEHHVAQDQGTHQAAAGGSSPWRHLHQACIG